MLFSIFRSRVTWPTIFLVVASFVFRQPACAQDSSQSSGKEPSPVTDTSNTTPNPEKEPATPVTAEWPSTYFYQIGTAGLLAGSPEGLRWGRLYIPTADVREIIENVGETSTQPSDVLLRTLFETTIIYDRQFGTKRLAVQYNPRLAIADGQVIGDFSNQNTSIDMLLYSRPRWSVSVGDTFQYYYTQQSFEDMYLDLNANTITTLANNFVDSPNRWLSNAAHASISYALSQRSSITIAPEYTYMESGVGVGFTHGQLYGGEVNWNYRTSLTQTVGLMYSSQVIHIGATSASSSDTIFQTVAGTWERQVAATWMVRGSLGLTTESSSPSPRQWSYYGNASFAKNFNRSSLGLTYSRGDSFANGFISDQYTDRIDLSYLFQMNRRLSSALGGGYLRQVSSGGFDARYANAEVDLLLAPRASLYTFCSYTWKNQSGNDLGLFAGEVQLISFGIRWQPKQPNVPRH